MTFATIFTTFIGLLIDFFLNFTKAFGWSTEQKWMLQVFMLAERLIE